MNPPEAVARVFDWYFTYLSSRPRRALPAGIKSIGNLYACKFGVPVNCVNDNHPQFLAVCRSFLPKSRRVWVLHRTFALHASVFHRTINLLPTTYPPRMAVAQNSLQPESTPAHFLLRSFHLNDGGNAVDLSLRLDVLAVCAVFVFVGAILLGAF